MHLLNHLVETGDLLPNHLRDGVDQRLVNHLSARRFPDAGVPCAVGQHHNVAGEPGVMRATNVEQHAVLPRHRDDLHLRHDRA